jgi:hypothetical protein
LVALEFSLWLLPSPLENLKPVQHVFPLRCKSNYAQY